LTRTYKNIIDHGKLGDWETDNGVRASTYGVVERQQRVAESAECKKSVQGREESKTPSAAFVC
jgi:hypothetical protein